MNSSVDTAHEHRFEPVGSDYPLFEDYAAMLHEACEHETVVNEERGYRGEYIATETIPCEETRWRRCSPVKLTTRDGDVHDLSGVAPDELPPEPGGILDDLEGKSGADENVQVLDVAPGMGIVIAKFNGHRIRYEE